MYYVQYGGRKAHTEMVCECVWERKGVESRETDSIKTNIDCNLRSDFDVKVFSFLLFTFRFSSIV